MGIKIDFISVTKSKMNIIASDEMIQYGFFFIMNFFTLLFGIKTLFNSFGLSYKNLVQLVLKINSIVHGIIIWYVSLRYLSNTVTDETFLHYVEMSKAYAIYDTFIMIYYKKYIPGLAMGLLHHMLFIFALHSPFLQNHKKFAAKALSSEITNIFLYFGWILLKKGYQKSMIFLINGGILITLFLNNRVLNFTNLFITSLAVKGAIYEQIFMFIITIMNIYWFVKLLEKFLTGISTLLRNN